MDFGAKVLIVVLLLSFVFQDSGWIIAYALLEVADAIQKKGKVE